MNGTAFRLVIVEAPVRQRLGARAGVAEQLFVDGGGGDALPRAVPVRVVAPPEQRARLFEGAPRGFDQRRLQVQEAKTLTLAQLAHHDGEARRLFRRSPRRRAVERPRVDLLLAR